VRNPLADRLQDFPGRRFVERVEVVNELFEEQVKRHRQRVFHIVLTDGRPGARGVINGRPRVTTWPAPPADRARLQPALGFVEQLHWPPRPRFGGRIVSSTSSNRSRAGWSILSIITLALKKGWLSIRKRACVSTSADTEGVRMNPSPRSLRSGASVSEEPEPAGARNAGANMSINFNDAQLALLNFASQRNDHCLVLPKAESAFRPRRP
jgi:hypothetical protein